MKKKYRILQKNYPDGVAFEVQSKKETPKSTGYAFNDKWWYEGKFDTFDRAYRHVKDRKKVDKEDTIERVVYSD